MKKLNLAIEVSDDLEIFDKCYNESINLEQQYDRDLLVETSVSKTLISALSGIQIRAKTWAKQKLAEHCNNIIVSHIGNLSKPGFDQMDIYYPHLRIFVYVPVHLRYSNMWTRP